ncbi:hypothetical protein EV646_105346 [Kribbella antiqua]|uniref:Uncharacterized protein n=1 Tax=Kribbella antiqua TaxID=2512217 RepID=A0A4R2IU41_9ACTN|nr:DUF6461 domain-containing protein [Kribbella antiqua]TCO47789.1 hypothetical protein EV646_105346 [Kribbella antiqua]
MSAEDYTWFRDTPFIYGYCLTLVQGIDPGEALRRLDAEPSERATGSRDFTRFAERSHPWAAHRNDGRFGIGAVQLEGWTLLLEWNGFLGVTPEVIRPLSAGTRVVSHHRNVDAEDRFCWMEDGDLRLKFEPLFPFHRSGSDPDGLLDVMERIGFDLRDIEDRDFELNTEAAFALAEHLTGVRVTQELLDTAEYLCGRAPLKR